MNRTRLLYLTILIEGYVVLAVELLAIRQVLPFVGSGVEVVAIIISGVLLPLAVGYHYGGTAYRRIYDLARQNNWGAPSIRKILRFNLLIASLFLVLGLSYLSLTDFFGFLSYHGIRHRLWQASAYTLSFLVVPVFLLGQTVPLISHYFPRRRLNEITGRMLFFSTAGAFLGSVFSTLVLMMTIGVHNTVIVTIGLLCVLCVLLCRRRQLLSRAIALVIFCVALLLNNGSFFASMHIVSDDAYNIALVGVTKDDAKYLMLNRSFASIVSKDPRKRASYVRYIEKMFIETMRDDAPHNILVLGAGGFAIGMDDAFNDYTFVDIDPELKRVAEDYVLPSKLTPNKQFVVSSARAFLIRDTNTYDLIIIDLFQNTYAIPLESATREFLQAAKVRLRGRGILLANIIESPDFREPFAVRYDRTFGSVFPVHDRHIIGDFNPYDPSLEMANVIYAYFNSPLMQDRGMYTDDRNTYSVDRP